MSDSPNYPGDAAYNRNLHRLRLDAKSGVFPSGEMEGKVPIPLTQEEYDRFLLTFSYGDEVLTASANRSRYELDPEQDELQESLRAKVFRPVIAIPHPTVLLDIDFAAEFFEYASIYYEPNATDVAAGRPPIDNFKRDSVWVKWRVAKQYNIAFKLKRLRNEDGTFVDEVPAEVLDEDGHPINSPNGFSNRIIETVKEDYDDDTPCQIIFTRKAVYGGSEFYVKDVEHPELLDSVTPLVTLGEAGDFYDTDIRVKTAIDANTLRPDDGWLGITISQSALAGLIPGILEMIDPPGGPGDPGGPGKPGGPGDPGDPGDPTDPPIQPFPPGGRTGGEQPPPGGYPPPAPPTGIGGRVELVCEDNPIYSVTGTNHTESFASFLGIDIPGWLTPLLLGVPLPDVYDQVTNVDIYSSVLAAISASGELPTGATVTRIGICYHWIGTVYYGISALGIESFISKKASVPKLIAHRTSGSTTLTTYQLKNDALYAMVDFGYGVPGTPVELNFAWKVGEATPDQHIAISQFNKVDTLTLNAKLYAAFSDFFGTLPVSPILWVGLEEFDYLLSTSRFSAHFDLDNITFRENPYVSGQMVWFSDNPDGYISGMAVVDPALYTGSESAGHGNVMLANNTSNPLQLLKVADGYSTHPDSAYTTATVTLQCASSAQDVVLNFNLTNSGPGTNFTQTVAAGGFTGPPYVYFPSQKVLTYDISSLGLTTSSTIFRITLGPVGMYIWEWSIILS